jgi:predicted HicB family RNase H-like nuclease
VSAVALAKEKIINIRVDSELKREAKRMAEDDGRSLSNWILRLIQDEIKRNQKDTKNKKAR